MSATKFFLVNTGRLVAALSTGSVALAVAKAAFSGGIAVNGQHGTGSLYGYLLAALLIGQSIYWTCRIGLRE